MYFYERITEAMLLTEEIVSGMLTSAEGTKCETYRIVAKFSFGKTTENLLDKDIYNAK